MACTRTCLVDHGYRSNTRLTQDFFGKVFVSRTTLIISKIISTILGGKIMKLRNSVSVCLLLLLSLNIIGNFLPHFIIRQVKASPSLSFTHPDADHYILTSNEWNVTITHGATDKWFIDRTEAKDTSNSFQKIYAITQWYFHDAGWKRFYLDMATVETNSSSLKSLSIKGNKTWNNRFHNYTVFINITETSFTYTVRIDANATVTWKHTEKQRARVTHLPTEYSDKNQIIWFGRGHIYRGKTFFYAEISSNGSRTGVRDVDPTASGYQSSLDEAVGSWTTYETTMYCLYQSGGTFFDFAEKVSDKMESLYGLDSPYQYRKFHDTLELLPDKIIVGRPPIAGWSELVSDKEGAYKYSAHNKYYIGAGEGGNTGQIGNEFLTYYDFSQDETILNHTKKIANFICNRATNTSDWFFYESTDADGNALLEDYAGQEWIWLKKDGLVSEFLLRMYVHTGNTTYKTYALNNLNFWLSKQESDGSWAFKYNGRDLTPVGPEEYYRTIMVAPLADALIHAYDVTGSSTYKSSAISFLDWGYTKLTNGTNTAGWQWYWRRTPSEETMKMETPINIPHFQSCLLNAYETFGNSTYLTWAENIEKYRRIFVQKANGNDECKLAYLGFFSEVMPNAMEMQHFAVEPLSKLAYYTGNTQYAKEAVYAQRAMRQYQRDLGWHFYDYWQIWPNSWATTGMLWYSSDYLESAIYLKKYVGDVYLGSQQYSIDEEITVTGDGGGTYGYVNQFDANIIAANHLRNKLTLTISAPSGTTSTTKVYCGTRRKDKPHKVWINNNKYAEGDHWTYDHITKTLTVKWSHSSIANIQIRWRGPRPGR